MPYCLEITDDDLKTALGKSQKKQAQLPDVKAKLGLLTTLWNDIARVVIISELPYVGSDELHELEKVTIRINKFWRDQFGVALCSLIVLFTRL